MRNMISKHLFIQTFSPSVMEKNRIIYLILRSQSFIFTLFRNISSLLRWNVCALCPIVGNLYFSWSISISTSCHALFMCRTFTLILPETWLNISISIFCFCCFYCLFLWLQKVFYLDCIYLLFVNSFPFYLKPGFLFASLVTKSICRIYFCPLLHMSIMFSIIFPPSFFSALRFVYLDLAFYMAARFMWSTHYVLYCLEFFSV